MGLLKRIHVNMHRIRRNAKYPGEDLIPVITVKTSKSNTYGYTADIQGGSKVVYRPDKPLSCGARLWIETHAPVEVETEEGMVRVR